MTDIMKAALHDLINGDMPDSETITQCFNDIMNGDVSQVQMSAFLVALKMRGERVEDIAAAASVMRAKATTINAPDGTMDIVGTG
ncbi:MAG: anthranilate phosphoribosyltransferase, partial [Alphaproteobacteria bacterium]